MRNALCALLAVLFLSASAGASVRAPRGPAAALAVDARGVAAKAKNATTIPHTLRIGDIEDITSLNPHLATIISLGDLSQMTMAYLVRYGPDNRPIPELATAVPTQKNHLISRDGLTITWHLRRGVRWSDGAPFDADDVVFSTNAVNNPRNNEVSRDGWELITKVDEPDKYTVVYHLKRPYAPFLPTFFGTSGANPCILPKHILGSLPDINNAPYNSKPVGIGPFRYVEWVRNDHVTLEANPYYWRGVPKLQKIVYKFIPDYNTLLTQLQTGEVDLWPRVSLNFYDRVKRLPNVTTIHAPGYAFTHLDFNLSRPLFADRAVREALRFALDRQTLRDKVQHGLGILQEGPITPVSDFHADMPRVPYDPGRAKALLDAAGWKPGPDGIRAKGGRRLVLDFALASGQPDVDQIVELIRSMWQPIGVQLNVRHYPATIIFAPYQQGGILYAGKFDVIYFAWDLTADLDLTNIFGCDQAPPVAQNIDHYCNSAVDALLQQERLTYDADVRRPIIVQVQRKVVTDIPLIVMWIRENIYAYDSDLTGWHPNSVTPFDDMLNVDI